MLVYSESQQGYFSPTQPSLFPGNDVKGKPINGKREWTYPILISDADGNVYVQKSENVEHEGEVVPAREYLAT